MTAETAQHTPGPWRYTRQNNGGIGVFAGENYEHLLFEAPEFSSPNPADWALVEAAPDLLAAAEAALASMPLGWVGAANLADQLRAAIAKARGSAT